MPSPIGSPRALVVLGALVLAACGGSGGGTGPATPGVSGDTIYVGALTPLLCPAPP